MKKKMSMKSEALRMDKEAEGKEKWQEKQHSKACCGNHMKKHDGHPKGCCHEKQG